MLFQKKKKFKLDNNHFFTDCCIVSIVNMEKQIPRYFVSRQTETEFYFRSNSSITLPGLLFLYSCTHTLT